MIPAAILAGALMPIASVRAAFGAPVGRALMQDEPFTMTTSFTFPTPEFPTESSGCSTVMAGCTGTFVELQHDIAGEVTVIDDCTFRVTGWEFDGIGPAVEWWAAPQSGDAAVFPYSEGMAIKVGELGTGQDGDPQYVAGPSGGGTDDITVRLGTGADGTPYLLSSDLDHLSVWCEAFAIDFGNAALTCPETTAQDPMAIAGAPTTAEGPAPAPGAAAPSGAASTTPDPTGTTVGEIDSSIDTNTADAVGGTDANSDTTDAADTTGGTDANSDTTDGADTTGAAASSAACQAGLTAASVALTVAFLVVTAM